MSKFSLYIIRMAIVLLAILACMWMMALQGCKSVQKSHSSLDSSASTVAVGKLDSGRVLRTETSSSNTESWWREMIYPGVPLPDTRTGSVTPTGAIGVGGSTVILGADTTINQYYPIQPYIIREGGTRASTQSSSTVDSSWRKSFDSLAAAFTKKLEIVTVERKPEKRSGWLPLRLMLICFVLGFIARWLLSRYFQFQLHPFKISRKPHVLPGGTPS